MAKMYYYKEYKKTGNTGIHTKKISIQKIFVGNYKDGNKKCLFMSKISNQAWVKYHNSYTNGPNNIKILFMVEKCLRKTIF
jgi:hypothetical protein